MNQVFRDTANKRRVSIIDLTEDERRHSGLKVGPKRTPGEGDSGSETENIFHKSRQHYESEKKYEREQEQEEQKERKQQKQQISPEGSGEGWTKYIWSSSASEESVSQERVIRTKTKTPDHQVQEKQISSEESAEGWTKYIWFTNEDSINQERLIRKVTKTPYHQVHDFLRNAQWIFAVFALVAIVVVPQMRSFFVERALTQKCLYFLVECMVWAGAIKLLGRNMFPVNYMAFFIIRLMVALELQFEYEEVPGVPEKSWGLISILTSWFAPAAPPVVIDNGPSLQRRVVSHLALSSVLIGAGYVITRFTKIAVWQLENIALLGCFLCSVGGALIFLCATAMPTVVTREAHLKICTVWASLTFFLITFLTMFLFQRMWFVVFSDEGTPRQRKIRMDNSFRVMIEVIVTFVEIYLVIRYIRLVHPEFSFREGLPAIGTLVKGLPVPDEVQTSILQLVPAMYFVIINIMENYYLTLPTFMSGDSYKL